MKHQPERTCIGCRGVFKKNEVVRIVAGPAGVLIDFREKLPGRAAYVCPRRECIGAALAKQNLARALHLKVRTPDAAVFVSELAALIRERIRSLLSVAIKAGKIAAGYSAVQDALEKGRVEFLLYAADLSEGTRDKVASRGSEALRRETLFTCDELGGLFGRELIGVVGILDKGFADAVWNETQRLKGLINDGN
jgi:predicted RNA-binding protein YlxR (DUF448 family)